MEKSCYFCNIPYESDPYIKYGLIQSNTTLNVIICNNCLLDDMYTSTFLDIKYNKLNFMDNLTRDFLTKIELSYILVNYKKRYLNTEIHKLCDRALIDDLNETNDIINCRKYLRELVNISLPKYINIDLSNNIYQAKINEFIIMYSFDNKIKSYQNIIDCIIKDIIKFNDILLTQYNKLLAINTIINDKYPMKYINTIKKHPFYTEYLNSINGDDIEVYITIIDIDISYMMRQEKFNTLIKKYDNDLVNNITDVTLLYVTYVVKEENTFDEVKNKIMSIIYANVKKEILCKHINAIGIKCDDITKNKYYDNYINGVLSLNEFLDKIIDKNNKKKELIEKKRHKLILYKYIKDNYDKIDRENIYNSKIYRDYISGEIDFDNAVKKLKNIEK